MSEAGQSQFAGARRTAGNGGCFANFDVEASLSEQNRGGQAVGPAAYDDGAALHAFMIWAGLSRVRGLVFGLLRGLFLFELHSFAFFVVVDVVHGEKAFEGGIGIDRVLEGAGFVLGLMGAFD